MRKIALLFFYQYLVFVPIVTFAQVNIIFFDVGEGAATLVQGSNSAVLIDAGNPASAPDLFKKIKQNIKKLDAFLITHPHPDHTGALYFIIDKFKSLHRYDNGEVLDLKPPDHWYLQQFRSHNYRILHQGHNLQFDTFNIVVLSPPKERLGVDWNSNSLVLKIVSNNFCALLMADALINTEEYLLRTKQAIQCPIIQVGHHGSKYASTDNFIKSVSAKHAVISVNNQNIHGYPNNFVVKNWQKSVGQVLQTNLHGDIKVQVSQAGDYKLELERK